MQFKNSIAIRLLGGFCSPNTRTKLNRVKDKEADNIEISQCNNLDVVGVIYGLSSVINKYKWEININEISEELLLQIQMHLYKHLVSGL